MLAGSAFNVLTEYTNKKNHVLLTTSCTVHDSNGNHA